MYNLLCKLIDKIFPVQKQLEFDLYNKKIPETIDEAIDLIYNMLETSDIDYIYQHFSSDVHDTLGRAIRNNWRLWRTTNKSKLKEDFKNRFGLYGHPDDISGMVLNGVWAKAKDLNIEVILDETCEMYRKHWINFGVDPKTGEMV